MKIEFSKSKDDFQTFCADGIFYHSKYSPQKEAQRFVENLTLPFCPGLVFIVEPGLDYSDSYFKNTFSGCKTAAIRLFDNLLLPAGSWDFVIPFENEQSFKQTLMTKFGEDKLLSSAIFVWPAAKNIFPDEVTRILSIFKDTVEECKTLLVTRQFFEKKWLTNSFNFICNVKTTCLPKIKEKMPVVVCASGPSLKPCIELIKTNRKKLIVICLSSATSVLLKNQIIPDLVLSTDGGWYAGEHLKKLKQYKDIHIAAPVEAYIPKSILKNNPVIPLVYDDSSSFISGGIISKTQLECLKAVRNPTVSGTAYFFVQQFNPSLVFFCGLDLSGSKGDSHTQPNELELNNLLNDNRIKTKEKRVSASYVNSDSLKIYQEWFSSLENADNKVCRVIDSKYKNNSLGNILDISSVEFSAKLEQFKEQESAVTFIPSSFSGNCKSKVYNYILEKLKTSQWQKQLFPADFIAMEHMSIEQEQDKQKAQERLNSKVEKLIFKLRTLAGE